MVIGHFLCSSQGLIPPTSTPSLFPIFSYIDLKHLLLFNYHLQNEEMKEVVYSHKSHLVKWLTLDHYDHFSALMPTSKLWEKKKNLGSKILKY